MKSSYSSFEMMINQKKNVLIFNESEKININESKLKVFAQNDVIKSFFNGIDETLLAQITQDIENYSNESLDTLLKNIENNKKFSKEHVNIIKSEIEYIKENSMIIQEFLDKLENIQNTHMKNSLDEIEIMPSDEIINMSET